ncbi:MAG: TetR/AcrR family transcriptional regulator [Merismopedia sp. SIO2A8]|nr:TetR/AcrR family transcriptional regulator [Merismopedia sp. SIO2A8]
METFWQYGYEGTSIQTLLNAMGLNRGSLYDTFGDKRSLFLEAIAHYEKQVMQKMIIGLEAPDAGKAEIVHHFQNLLQRVEQDQQTPKGGSRTRWGCFVTNAAVEVCSRDAEASDCIRQSLQRVEQAFRHALHNAQQRGEIAAGADVGALASFFTCTMQGFRVMSKVNPDPQVLHNVVSTALSLLEPI